MKNILYLISTLFILASCASARHSSGSSYMHGQAYKSKGLLSTSLFASNEVPLTESNIQKILSSKIKLPRKSKLGVIKLEQVRGYQSNSNSFVLNEELSEKFFKKLESSKRLSGVWLMPSIMVKEPRTLSSLRESAVRMQANLLLILRSENITDFDFDLFNKNRSQAISTVEAVLVDIRTGVIVFTSVSTETSLLKEKKDDLTRKELIRRSITKAENGALVKIADDLLVFLNSMP